MVAGARGGVNCKIDAYDRFRFDWVEMATEWHRYATTGEEAAQLRAPAFAPTGDHEDDAQATTAAQAGTATRTGSWVRLEEPGGLPVGSPAFPSWLTTAVHDEHALVLVPDGRAFAAALDGTATVSAGDGDLLPVVIRYNIDSGRARSCADGVSLVSGTVVAYWCLG